ncbi:MAG: PDZ domain-containing protein [Firmicutes bacterium]|nr:PDZ domain-containing protein [Bacillota bacterium]
MEVRQRYYRRRRSSLGIIALVLVVFSVGVLFGANLRSIAHRFGIHLVDNSFAKLEAIYSWVKQHHVDPDALDPLRAVEDAIRGMLPHVDGGYTRYESAEEAKEFTQSTLEGKYSGVGIQSKPPVGGEMEVEIVFRGSPAEASGVKVRDKIIAVDGQTIMGLTQMEINSRIRGEAGTEVTLTILREGEPAPLNITIRRGIITLPVVDYWVDGEIGIIAMNRFTETAPEQLREAIEAVKQKQVEAILLDLRSNGGGLLYSAQEIVDFFLPADQVIVRQVDRYGNEQILKTTGGTIWDGPLAILLNGASASASEVVAGALQDHKRAVLLGEVSFGKGTVQVPYPLPDGSRLWITQYRYLTPAGQDIHEKGLSPDYVIEQPEKAQVDEQLQQAVKYVREKMLQK